MYAAVYIVYLHIDSVYDIYECDIYIYIYIYIYVYICIYIQLYIKYMQLVHYFKTTQFSLFSRVAGVSRAGARTGLQLQGHGDMQGFDSSSPANLVGAQLAHASMTLSCIDFHTVKTMWLHVDTQKETRGSRIS